MNLPIVLRPRIGFSAIPFAGTAASAAATTSALAGNAAVGTAKFTGKSVGAATDAVLPGDTE